MTKQERLDKYKERLELYYAAEEAVLTGQRYKIGTRELERANLTEIRQEIKYLENTCEELEVQLNSRGKRRAYRIVPRDL